jgi:hypothetical protein
MSYGSSETVIPGLGRIVALLSPTHPLHTIITDIFGTSFFWSDNATGPQVIRGFALSDYVVRQRTFTHISNAPSVHLEVHIGLGHVVALHHRASTSHQIR